MSGCPGEIVEGRERLLEVEDDRLVVGRFDRGVGIRVLRLVRSLVALRQVENRLPVRRTVREGLLVGRAQHGVLHVGRGDLGAVVELDALAQLVGPGLPAVARLAGGLREIWHQRVALFARRRFEHHQRAAVQPREVPRVGVVGLAGVQGVPVSRVGELQGAAFGLRGIDDRCGSGIEPAATGWLPDPWCWSRLRPRRRRPPGRRSRRRPRSLSFDVMSNGSFVVPFWLSGDRPEVIPIDWLVDRGHRATRHRTG